MNRFDKLGLSAPLVRALTEQQHTTPTPIQSQAIPPALQGSDVLGCAQTGTGKTAAFALPVLQRLSSSELQSKAEPHRPQALILAPTRELAIQIDRNFATYGTHLKLRRTVVFGGVNQARQVRELKRGSHILIATPGRLLDLMNQGHIRLDQVKVFVLDEVDRMLDMGFLPEIQKIVRCLPRERQSLFFSATLPPLIRDLSRRLLSDPVTVSISPKSPSVDAIQQQVRFVETGQKQGTLESILSGPEVERVLVFSRTKRGANKIARQLSDRGIRALAIHGNKSQNARLRALDAFQRQKVKVLVATDVASRGIHVDGVSHVINFDVPEEPESYLHRIGRTGRAGKDGVAVTLCARTERRNLRAIEQFTGRRLQSPDGTSEPVESHSTERPARRPARDQRRTRDDRQGGGERAKPRTPRKPSARYRDDRRGGSEQTTNRPRRRQSATKRPQLSAAK